MPRALRRFSCCLLSTALLFPTAAWAQIADARDPGYASSLPTLGDPAQGSFSAAQEKRLGEIIMREMRQEPAYLHDSLLRDYLQSIVDRLTPAARRTAEMEAPRQFHVFLLRDRSFNAFALPGGWIGVHTGMVIDAQSHDQVAAVFAHEMSHITQRHIAQRLAQAGKDRLLSIGSLILAIVAASAGQDQAAQGLALGGQAAAIDNALRFSRSNERDADRTGEEVLADSGYPPQAMASMLLRLQNLSRLDDTDVFAFLQTHPLTGERIADAQARGGNKPLPPDHDLLFWLMNARARALTPQSHDAMLREERQFAADTAVFPAQQAAWAYGQAVVLQRLKRFDAAASALARAQAAANHASAAERLPLDLLHTELLLDTQPTQALESARTLRTQFPQSAATLHLLSRCLLAQPNKTPARDFLRQQTVASPQDITLWEDLARADAATGAFAAQHRATAKAYALQGKTEAAIEQLRIAQRTPGADYFEASIIDARLRALEQEHAQHKLIDKTLPQ
ncbi:MAG: peptidase M48 Ste24p [Thiomonas sp. 20-64-5]|nr:MAG: peptidase M48 Ste24p [Thiomonas sp. 20-64-5]